MERREKGRCMKRVTEIYNTICKRDNQWEFALWLQGLCDRLSAGWVGGPGGRRHGCAYGWLLLIYDRKPQNSVKQLSFNFKKKIIFKAYCGNCLALQWLGLGILLLEVWVPYLVCNLRSCKLYSAAPQKGESLLHLIHCSQTLVYSENLRSAFQLYLNVYSLFFF